MKKLRFYLLSLVIIALAIVLFRHGLEVKSAGSNDVLDIKNAKIVISNAKIVIGQPASTTPSSSFALQSIDVMKYTKDNICGQSTTSTIDSMIADVKAAGANYISISGYYDDPSCASDQAYMTKWVGEIRASGLKVWWRMKDLSWEGDYSVTKATSTIVSGVHQGRMDTWLNTNSSNTPLTMLSGDVFTPFAEVQNGGINGINYCGPSSVCQFANQTEFNTFIHTVYTDAKARVPAGVKVGYWGFDGFILAGLNNPDHQGSSYLDSTSLTQSGEVTVDDYPSSYGSGATGVPDNYAAHLPIFHTVIQSVTGSSTIPLIIGEYGTINATSTVDQNYQINLEVPMAQADSLVKGFNYWNLGPVNDITGEGLIKNDFSLKPGYTSLQHYFLGGH